MKKHLIAAICLFVAVGSTLAQGGPTMGWSSWNTYGVNISDALIRSQADAMVAKGLDAVGYDHINIDDGFFGGRNTDTERSHQNRKREKDSWEVRKLIAETH